jgi:hypothetical protein
VKFAIRSERALLGNDIDVQIDAESDEMITLVICTLDGCEVGSDDLSQAPVVSFHRTFCRVGEAQAGKLHRFMAEVFGNFGEGSKRASRIWNDLT